jgi:hypothetical protein
MVADRADRAVIVHPLFKHTLPKLVVARDTCTFQSLPLQVLHCIAAKIQTAKDLINYERVSRATWLAAADDMHWKRLCYQRFSVPRMTKCLSWRELYKFNHEILYNLLLWRRQASGPDFRAGVYIHIPVVA